MAALQYVDVPQYAALILRRTYKQLTMPGSLIPRSKEWLIRTTAKWSNDDKAWRFPSGAQLVFGHLEHEEDKYRYDGTEWHFVGFDEVTHFTLTMYLYLFGRLRRKVGDTLPLRMRSASNPGKLGHEWVKNRFVKAPVDAGRPFIRALLRDNPYIDQAAYIRGLSELDPVTRQRILEGDWDAREDGGFFKRHWFEIVDVVPRELTICRAWDKASTEPKAEGDDPDYTAGVKMGRGKDGLIYVLDVQRFRHTPKDTEVMIQKTAERDMMECSIYMEQEPGSSGVDVIDHYQRAVLSGYRFEGVPSTGNKAERAGPYSSQAEAGNVKILRGAWNDAYLDELELFPMKDVHDDQVDASSLAYAKLTHSLYHQIIGGYVGGGVVAGSRYRGESIF